YAQSNYFAHIIAAKSERPRWRDFFSESLTQRLIRAAGDASVHIIPRAKDPPRNPAGPESTARKPRRIEVRAYIASLAYVAAATLVAALLRQTLGVSNLAQVFLIAVLASAVTYGLWASLFACFVSVLSYNFFFLPPLYTFTIADPENVVTLFFFTVVALIASNLAARVRAQAVAARERARITEELYLFSRKLAGTATLDDLLWATAHQIALMLKVRVVLLLPENGGLARPDFRRKTCSTKRILPRRDGALKKTKRPGAAPIRCPARNAASCPCAPGVARWVSPGSIAISRGFC